MNNIFYVIKNIGHHARLRGKDHRTCWGFPLIENIPPCSRKKGCFSTKLSPSCLFLLCHKFPPLFPNHAFRNAHFSRVRAFPQGKPPLYFVACYYAQYRMRSAILRNHLNYFIYSFLASFLQNELSLLTDILLSSVSHCHTCSFVVVLVVVFYSRKTGIELWRLKFLTKTWLKGS